MAENELHSLSREGDHDQLSEEMVLSPTSLNMQENIASGSGINYKVKLEWKDVHYEVSTGYGRNARTIEIIRGISGYILPGEVKKIVEN